MMLTILSPVVRRARVRSRIRLIILAAGMGIAGGAWAAGRSPSSYALQVVDVRTGEIVTRAATDSAIRATARTLADRLYALADAVPGPPAPPRAPVHALLLAGGSVPAEQGGLKILITEAWAMPGALMVAPLSDPFDDE